MNHESISAKCLIGSKTRKFSPAKLSPFTVLHCFSNLLKILTTAIILVRENKLVDSSNGDEEEIKKMKDDQALTHSSLQT